jgi:hypothetical protein
MGILRDAIAQRRNDRNSNSPQDSGRSRLLPRISDYAPTGNSIPNERVRGSRRQRHGSSLLRQAAEHLQTSPSRPVVSQGDQPRYYTSAVLPYPAEPYTSAPIVERSYRPSSSPPPLPTRPVLSNFLPMPQPSDNPIPYPNPAPPSYNSTEYFDYSDTSTPSFLTEQVDTLSSYGRNLPLAIPQINYGTTSPFIRGYNEDLLGSRGITQARFISWLDSLNVACMPSAELQIVGKVAGIAGLMVYVLFGFGSSYIHI